MLWFCLALYILCGIGFYEQLGDPETVAEEHPELRDYPRAWQTMRMLFSVLWVPVQIVSLLCAAFGLLKDR